MKKARVQEYLDRLDAAKTPQQRARIYREYADELRRDSFSAPAYMGSGAVLGALTGYTAYMRHKNDLLDHEVGGKAQYLFPLAGAAIGALGGAVASTLRPDPQRSVKKETTKKNGKTAAVMEGKYSPGLHILLSPSSEDATYNVLTSDKIPDKLKRELIKTKTPVLDLETNKRKGRNAFYAGGRPVFLLGIPEKHRAAVIAHELGHKKKRHYTRTLATLMASPLLGYAIGRKLGKKIDDPVKRRSYSRAGMVAGSLASFAAMPLIASEVHERQADRMGARLASPKQMEDALTSIMKEHTKGDILLRKGHFNRPESKLDRGLSRVYHAYRGKHPPLWSRIDTIREEAEKIRQEKEEEKRRKRALKKR